MREQRTDRVARVDRWAVRMDAVIATDSRGFAQIWGTVISADAVLEYGPPDGAPAGHFEFVPESTVFDEAALATLRNAPVTFLHPPEPVTAQNSARHTVGHIIDVKRDGDRLRALHQIEDQATLDKIAGGVVELSPGYTVSLVDPPAGMIVDGKPIAKVQEGREYNHNAIVPEARAGHDNALSIDGSVLPAGGLMIQARGPAMAEYVFDGKKVEVDADLLAHIQKLAASGSSDGGKDDASGDDDDKPDEKSAAGEGGSEDAKSSAPADASNDAATSEDAKPATLDEASIAKMVDAAVGRRMKDQAKADSRSRSILTTAARVLPPTYNADGKSDRDIMLDSIKTLDADMLGQAKGLDDVGLHGMFIGLAGRKKDSAPKPVRIDGGQKGGGLAKVFELQQARIDAAANCGVAGQDALRHPEVRAVGKEG